MSYNLPKILIAEDDVLLRDIWKQKIGKGGFDVITAIDGVEAMEKIEQEHPQLLLLDIVMPNLDGFGVLEQIRNHADENIKKMVVIMLTNLGTEEDVNKAKKLGSDGFMIKAMFSTEDIIDKLNEYKEIIPEWKNE